MASPTVSVTIATHNRWPLLEQCLRSLLQQPFTDIEILLVDQGSTDGTPAAVRRQFTTVQLITLPHNHLYCRAQNAAIRVARGDFVLALNDDVVLHRDFLAHAVRAMGEDPHIGLVCGKVLSWDARHIDGAGQQPARSGQPEDRGYRQRDTGQFDAPADVFGPGGAAPLLRRRMLEELADNGQHFDERLGCFFEDLDLAWRAQRRGWRARYAPSAVAYHYRGGTAQGPRPHGGGWTRFDLCALPLALQQRYVANRHYVLRKHRAWDRWQTWPWMLAYEAGLLAYACLRQPALLPAWWARTR